MTRRLAGLIAVAMTAGVLVAPGAAVASTSEAVADTGGMTLTLGAVGAPLDVAVTLDEIGHITEVAVGDGFTEDRATDHKVRFSNEDGTTRVDVRAKKDKVSASVKTDDLSAIVGSHMWAGKLFGSDTDTIVAFDIIENTSGHPEITNIVVTALNPADATSAVGAVKNEIEDDEAESSVRVTFTWNGYTMTLKIAAEAEFEDDDDDDGYEAKLKVELRGRDIQKLSEQNLADLVGSYTWDGRLCDGTDLAVAYTISDDGAATVDTVTIAGAASDAYELKIKPHGFTVDFDGTKARLSVDLKEKDGGLWDLKVKSKTTEKCDHDDKSDHDDDDKSDHDDDDDKKDKDRDRDKKDKERDKDEDRDDDDHDDDDEDEEDDDKDDE